LRRLRSYEPTKSLLDFSLKSKAVAQRQQFGHSGWHKG
jgi:hypothetical protein